MLSLHHKQNYVKVCVSDLFAHEHANMLKMEIDFIKANAEAKGRTKEEVSIVVYRNVVFPTYPLKKGTGTPLMQTVHSSLIGEADNLIKLKKQLLTDAQIIGQNLHSLVRNCKSEQDLRDAIPDAAQTKQMLSALPRTRPELWSFAGSDMLREQFTKAEDLIHYYAGTKLFY